MENVDQRLAFIGIDCGSKLSSVRGKPEQYEPVKRKDLGRSQDPRKKKLYRQYQQLMKKMAIQQRIDEREQKASQRLQQIQNKRQESKVKKDQTWNKIQHVISQDSLHEPSQAKKPDKEKFPGKAHKMMSSTSKENAFRAYHNKSKIPSGLPTLYRPKTKLNAPKNNEEIDLVDFGIFSGHRNCEQFLRKFKGTIGREFVCGVDLNCQEDLHRLEDLLMKELRNQSK